MISLLALESGTVLERYTIEGLLGEGGMSVVYRAKHNQLGTTHALKVLSIASHDVRRRLIQEGQVQARLRHPNIVAVTDIVDVQGAPGLVMELIQGPSLDDLIEEGPLDPAQADAIAAGILRGVGAAHAMGLVHRDLKPGNILLEVTEEGFVAKVADFGLAKVLRGDEAPSAIQTRTGMGMGTPTYMAPEQIRNAKAVDQRADIWALGCVLYEMITGYRAFDSEDLIELFTAISTGNFVPPGQRVSGLPPRMERAVLAAMTVDRERRPRDCSALLALWSEGEPVVPGRRGPWSEEVLKRYTAPGSGSPTARRDRRLSTIVPAPTLAEFHSEASEAVPGESPDVASAGRPKGQERQEHATHGVRGPDSSAIGSEIGQSWYAPEPGPEEAVPIGNRPSRRWIAGLLLGSGLLMAGTLGTGALVAGGLVLGVAGSASPEVPPPISTEVPPVLPVSAPEISPAPSPSSPEIPASHTVLPTRPDAGITVPFRQAVVDPESPSPDIRVTAPSLQVSAVEPEPPAPLPAAPPVDEAPQAAPAPKEAYAARLKLSAAPGPAEPDKVAVALRGDAESVRLVRAGESWPIPGPVPPGRYEVQVTFHGERQMSAGEFTIEAGRSAALTCQQGVHRCK